MRRKDREISEAETSRILKSCVYGILSCVCGDKPYAVPVNYVFIEGERAIYFHCAKEGKKLDCIAENPSVQLTAVGKADVVSGFTTKYESAIVEGTAGQVADIDEIKRALIELCEKYYPGTKTDSSMLRTTNLYIDKFLSKTAIVKIDIKSVSGKSNI